MINASKLKIAKIFYSLQGETRTVGIPTVFVRLTGCPLRCNYCDTSYAFKGGNWMEINDILAKVASWEPNYVTVTGGEPLAQENCLSLLTLLCNQNYEVSLETSGALDVSEVDHRVIKIVDFKTPGSQEEARNCYSNVDFLSGKDQVKFVICDQQDYEWSKALVNQYQLDKRCHVLFSPSHSQLSPKHLADWILQDRLKVRMQIQLHKYIWGDVPGK